MYVTLYGLCSCRAGIELTSCCVCDVVRIVFVSRRSRVDSVFVLPSVVLAHRRQTTRVVVDRPVFQHRLRAIAERCRVARSEIVSSQAVTQRNNADQQRRIVRNVSDNDSKSLSVIRYRY